MKALLFSDYFEKVINKKKVDGLREQTLRRINIIKSKSIEPSLFWNKRPSDIRAEDGLKFKEWHRKNRINERTGEPVQLVNVFKYLGETLRYMIDQGVLEKRNMPDIDLPLAEKRHHETQKGKLISRKTFSDIEVHFDKRYRLLLGMAYVMGNRKMELGSLRCDQIRIIEGRVYLDFSHEDTKTGLERIIPVPREFENELIERSKKNKLFIFESPTNADTHISAQRLDAHWSEAKNLANIRERIRFHDMRHTAATNMVAASLNPLMICTFLGMSMTVLQKKYLKLRPQDLVIIADTMLSLFKSDSSENLAESMKDI